ncbi:MAG: translation elongation factor Ts, partial [Rhodobacteraceae bacterium]|nr:translation elongation factor Ts [Paracoccaceae bacterium]
AKGMSKAAKKSSRETAEGLIGIAIDGNVGTIIEVNSETDFVARNSDFGAFVRSLLATARGLSTVEDLLATEAGGATVADQVTDQVAKIGENLVVRRLETVSAAHIASYVHNAVDDDLGKIGVLVGYDGNESTEGRRIAMHIAHSNPLGISHEDVPEDLVERERQVLKQKAVDSGKPENIIDRIIEGGLKKYLSEQALLNQKYIFDTNQTVGSIAKAAGITVTGFVRYKVGE